MVIGNPKWLWSGALLCVLSLAQLADAQTTPYQEYKRRLNDAPTGEAFLVTFRSMMSDIRSGLHVPDEEVAAIVAVARTKPYTELILPEVYGWAGSMFGNGRMEQAVVYFMESAEGYRQLNKRFAEALSYFEIALVQHRAENLDEAGEYYLKALATGGDSLVTRTRINCYNGLALISRERKQYPEAESEFRKALRVAIATQDKVWIGILYGNIGSLHLRQENYDSSLYYYRQNLSLIKNTSELENEIEAYGHIAKTLIGMKKFHAAIVYLDSAMQIIKDRNVVTSDFFNPMIFLSESYAHAHAGLGNHEKAFKYLMQFHEIATDRVQKTKGRSLKQLQLSYSFRQKQQEVDLLSEVNAANTAVIRQQRYTEIAFIAITVLLSVIVFLSIRTNRQRNRLNRELTSTNEELARLNNVKDKLFSVISHDLRGPLGNLHHLLTMISSGELSNEQFSSISDKLGHQIKTSGNALENLLYWARSQLHESVPSREKVLLAEVANHVIRSFGSDLEAKSITVENVVSGDCAALADMAQIEIVMRNLVGNAIKFSKPGGHILLTAKCKDGKVNFSIEDKGVGMTREQVESFHAGKPFTTPGTRMEKGTGIGLVIIREMINQNGGNIHLTSTPGVGTTFTLTLPDHKSGSIVA